jgi:hypothetical protein
MGSDLGFWFLEQLLGHRTGQKQKPNLAPRSPDPTLPGGLLEQERTEATEWRPGAHCSNTSVFSVDSCSNIIPSGLSFSTIQADSQLFEVSQIRETTF